MNSIPVTLKRIIVGRDQDEWYAIPNDEVSAFEQSIEKASTTFETTDIDAFNDRFKKYSIGNNVNGTQLYCLKREPFDCSLFWNT